MIRLLSSQKPQLRTFAALDKQAQATLVVLDQSATVNVEYELNCSKLKGKKLSKLLATLQRNNNNSNSNNIISSNTNNRRMSNNSNNHVSYNDICGNQYM